MSHRVTGAILLVLPGWIAAQTNILHFTKTSGYDHGTRGVSYTMFQSIAQELGIDVVDDQTGVPFSDPATLSAFQVIVFSNTSGNAILDDLQRDNFEAWVSNGGHVLGIHAATDTYRHSTANGANTGSWDFYAELIGASVQQDPNHVAGTPQYAMEHTSTHASTANLPDPWVKNEEYYYWEGGYYGPDNMEVLRVEETVGPNGQVNSYDAARPMSWYRTEPNGSRVFYTALGHAPDNFTSDMLFRTHIKDALVWLLDVSTGHVTMDIPDVLKVYPNPASEFVTVMADGFMAGMPIFLEDALGRVVGSGTTRTGRTVMRTDDLAPGHYLVRCGPWTARVQVAH